LPASGFSNFSPTRNCFATTAKLHGSTHSCCAARQQFALYRGIVQGNKALLGGQ
jgi:hypothetical protein